MEELDLLRKHWQKDTGFVKVNTQEIKIMLHKNSSSIIRWIFIISIIELSLGLVLNLLPNPPSSHSEFYRIFELISTGIFYVVIFYFIYQFFNNYRAIKNTDSTKVLLANIIKTRKNVGAYIQFNIYYFSILFLALAIDEIIIDLQTATNITSSVIFVEVLKIMVFSIIGILFILVIRTIYRLLYVRLLKKLNVNYQELETLEKE